MSTGIERIAERAKREPNIKFTSLAHHIDQEQLNIAMRKITRSSAKGFDKLDKEASSTGFNIWSRDVIREIHHRAYKAPPVVRAYIPKPGKNKMRPIGIPTIRDRCVQKLTSDILNGIYEQDFLPNSFGGRPKTSVHHAISSFMEICYGRKVNWVFEADLKNFFGSLDHDWVMKFFRASRL